jgi:lipopolysaccharide/colanic/teichoic acid biosynthesis glycosyltransferase
MIKLITPGPVFFSQKRVGQHAEIFTLHKFRTMKVDHQGSAITVKGENRITSLGSFLRKYKLDELPGFWNILKGQMSLVGPRPDVPGYADMLNPQDRVILDLKPGLTGPATLKYSNEEEMLARQADPAEYNDRVIYPDKVRINKHYIENWSFLLDLKIIIYTVLGKKLKDKWAQ